VVVARIGVPQPSKTGRGEMKQRLHRRVSKLLSACELQMFVVLNLRGVLCRARVIAGDHRR